MTKKLIAWGASKLLHMFLSNTDKNPFSYCIDSHPKQDRIDDLKVLAPDILESENKDSVRIVIFAVSNNALRAISSSLIGMGFSYKTHFVFYSDFFWGSFCERFFRRMGWHPHIDTYHYALSFTFNSVKPIHTTILGTVTFLECMKMTHDLTGDIAEVGSFEGGNALCALNYAAAANDDSSRKFYLFDSFEGFPNLSEHDPVSQKKKGDYCTQKPFEEIDNEFKIFPNVEILKGFVPDTFQKISEGAKFSLVFYDCDLYKPALDTFAFFWDRIETGGFLIIHDYECEPGGFRGVREATDEFFGRTKSPVLSFFENTMGIIKKR